MGKIIVIDDDQMIRQMLEKALKHYNVISFAESDELFKYIYEHGISEVDLFIVDIMLPGVSGLEIVDKLGKKKLLKCVPVLFLTALGDDHDIESVHKVGSFALTVDYIRKPFQIGWLLNRVKTLVKLKNYHHELKASNFKLSKINDELTKVNEKEIAKNQILKNLSSILNDEKTEVEKNLHDLKELFVKVAENDLPLIKILSELVDDSRDELKDIFFGIEDEGFITILTSSRDHIKKAFKNIEDILVFLLDMGVLSHDRLNSIDFKDSELYEKLVDSYDQGHISEELFEKILNAASSTNFSQTM